MKQLFQRLNRRKKSRYGKGHACDLTGSVSETTPVPFVSFTRKDDNSDGYHRYDTSLDVDFRGHYVESEGGQQPQKQLEDRVVCMALRASQKTLSESITEIDKEGNQCFEDGQVDEAFAKYEEALKMKRQNLLGQYNATSDSISPQEKANILASMATSINNLAYLRSLRGVNKPEETLESYQYALNIKKEILGPEHLSVGKTLNNIGSVHYLNKNYHEAAANYEQARDILRQNLGDSHLDVCTVTSNLGDVHYSLGQYQRAVDEYRNALQLRFELLGPQDPKVVRLMEQVAELEIKVQRKESSFDEEDTSIDSDQGSTSRDFHELQDDLEYDISCLESMEHDASIDIIKDKACVFRELRELSDTKAPGRPTRDDVNLQDVSGHTEDLTDVSQTSDSLSKSALAFFCGPVAEPQQQRCTLVAAPTIPARTDTALSPSQERKAEGVPLIKEELPVTPISPARLTPEERKEALSGVKDRLRKLREARETRKSSIRVSPPELPSLVTPLTIQPPVAPTSPILLKKSELLTISTGIESLRGVSGSHYSSRRSKARQARSASLRLAGGASGPAPKIL